MRTLVACLAFAISAGPAAAAGQLALNCAGTVSTTEVPKGGVSSDQKVETVTDWSFIVDLERRAVLGFWRDQNLMIEPLPIVAADANSVTFKADKKIPSKSIWGSVDRITAKVDVEETALAPNGNLTLQ